MYYEFYYPFKDEIGIIRKIDFDNNVVELIVDHRTIVISHSNIIVNGNYSFNCELTDIFNTYIYLNDMFIERVVRKDDKIVFIDCELNELELFEYLNGCISSIDKSLYYSC